MKVIDGDVLKRKAQKVATESWKMKIKANVETILNQFIDWIDTSPTIEPERKTGKWIRHIRYGDGTSVSDLDWKCSECGKNAIVDLEGLYQLTYYCPFCGAKMEGA